MGAAAAGFSYPAASVRTKKAESLKRNKEGGSGYLRGLQD